MFSSNWNARENDADESELKDKIMSLCVAWKYEDGGNCSMFFAADSCAVANDRVMPYSGVKVLEIPVRINSAAYNGRTEPIFYGNYGIAFVEAKLIFSELFQ